MEVKVAAIEIRREKVEKETGDLDKELSTVIEDHLTLEARQLKLIAQLEPKQIDTSESYRKNKERLEHMKRHTIELDKKVAEMVESITVYRTKTAYSGDDTAKLK